MKRHLHALFLVSGIALLCIAIGIIMAQTFLRKPTSAVPRSLSGETTPAP